MEINSFIDPFAHLHDENYKSKFSQPNIGASSLIFNGGRETHSLNGTWLCTLDPFDEGLRQQWFNAAHRNADSWDVPRDYEAEAGQEVEVPGCVNLYSQQWLHYEGSVWLTRDFDYNERSNKRVFLRIGAAAYLARVFLNGEFLGIHRGASTPFCVELPHLILGKNRLQIQVDNARNSSHVPMHHIDWFNYGGIYRDVSLIMLPKIFIADFGVALIPGSGFKRLRFDLQLSSPENGLAVVEIPELGITTTVELNAGKGVAEIDAKPELWSVDSPRLYSVYASYADDQVSDRVGFREIRVEGEDIFLNGFPLWLRGICVHEEYPETGKTSTESGVRAMLADAKALGCNFLRLSHYPHHECVAKLADELGFLL